MLENFIFSVNAVMPIFMLLAIGYIIRLRGWTDFATNRKMNAVVFNLGLPILMYRDVSTSDILGFFDGAFLIYALITTTLIFIVTMALGYWYFKDRKIAGSFSVACFRSNYAVMGLPLIARTGGEVGAGLGVLVIAFVIPLYNILNAIALAGKNDESLKGIAGLKLIVKNVFNPLMIGVLIGLVVSLLNIGLPTVVHVSIDYIARMTTPLALLVIGGSLDFSKIASRYKPAVVVAAIKLVVIPLIFVPIAIWLGFGPEAVLVLYVMYATPTAISSYAIVCNMGGDESLVLNSILLTMTLTVFTFTVGLFLLRTIGAI